MRALNERNHFIDHTPILDVVLGVGELFDYQINVFAEGPRNFGRTISLHRGLIVVVNVNNKNN